MEWNRSEELLERAKHVIAGGVNSNVRLTAIPKPLFFSHGEGPRITDVDGNTYLDYVLGQGQSTIKKLSYAPLPSAVDSDAKAQVKAMTCNGSPIA